MGFILDDERCAKIAKAARLLWNEFLLKRQEFTSGSILSARQGPATENQGQAALQFEQISFPRNECAVAFYRYCAETMAKVKTRVTNNVAIKQALASSVDGYPISWLIYWPGRSPNSQEDFESPTDPFAIALIDLQYLFLSTSTGIDLVWTRLLLHETGHLVLHWDAFIAQQTVEHSGDLVMATDEQEAEAWFFVSVITGLALGSYAFGCVKMPRRTQGDSHEDAWRYV